MVVGDVATAVDVLILGAGPAGYVAAIRAAQLGRRVTIVDPGPPGGTCLHRGCIPLKALVTASERYHEARTGLESFGIKAEGVSYNWSQVSAWKQGVVTRLSDGVAKLLSGNKVDVVHGTGWFINDHEARVEGEHGSLRFTFDRCLIATGAEANPLPDIHFDGKRVLTPEDALALQEFPKALTIFGNDYIALELATIFARLGAGVTLLLPGDTLFDGVDPAALRLVQAGLKALGVQIVQHARPLGIAGEILRYSTGESANEQQAPLPCIPSLGARPRLANLHLDAAGVKRLPDGGLVANTSGCTSNERIYAAGDCLGAPALASIAIKQAKVAAEAMSGARVQYAPQALPLVVHTPPELATVGLSPQAAEAAGYKTVVGRFPLAANGRALTLGTNAGQALIVSDAESEVVLGVTLVGPRAGDLIGQATLAIEMGATLTDLSEILYAHPGLSEVVLEGAESALGKAIHILAATPAKASR
ncbi:MAG TPA: FAD-dependent oxidoreductase [Ktedonobacterales bacterium]|jgi:dihydrolipoamide dehydrogenase